MKVYLVVGESGEYSDWTSWIESVHATRDGAVRAIEHRTYEVALDSDGEVIKPYELEIFGDDVHIAATLFTHPRGVGNAWLDPDGSYDIDEGSTWHIEEFEVTE